MATGPITEAADDDDVITGEIVMDTPAEDDGDITGPIELPSADGDKGAVTGVRGALLPWRS